MTCTGCTKPLGPLDYRWGVCFPCTKARHRAVLAKRCVCGRQKRPGAVCQIGSRRWLPCLRCLGTIQHLPDQKRRVA